MNKVKKQEQEVINYVSKNLYDMAMSESATTAKKRLNKCYAWVYETENFYVLQSYKTVVAVIEKGSDILADVLRLVYGYTISSAQQIAKFRRAYGIDKKGCKIEYRYYPVN